jgi:hypothetical protein
VLQLRNAAAPVAATPPASGAAAAAMYARFRAATDYVRRAIASITPQWWNVLERKPAEEKTAPYHHELDHIDARWWAAKSDQERATITRDAELLADHVEETMPGAPQDWKRTNLWKGETPQHVEATSYFGELFGPQGPAAERHAGELNKYIVGAAVGAGAFIAIRALLR